MNRTHIKETLTFAFLMLGIVLAAARCAAPLTPQEKQTIAFDAVQIAVCQEKGRFCKRTGGGSCFEMYSACIDDAGLRDGGAK